MFPSSIIVYGEVKIPQGFKEVEYGECGSNWIPDTYTLFEDISGIEWCRGDSLIVCSEGVYSKFEYIKQYSAVQRSI